MNFVDKLDQELSLLDSALVEQRRESVRHVVILTESIAITLAKVNDGMVEYKNGVFINYVSSGLNRIAANRLVQVDPETHRLVRQIDTGESGYQDWKVIEK